MSFAGTFPFCLARLAVLDAAEAREHAGTLAETFDHGNNPSDHDRLTRAFLDPQCPDGLRADVDVWRDLGTISRRLQRWRLAFRYVPLLEQRAEEPHRKVKTSLSFTSARGLRASLAVRSAEIIAAKLRSLRLEPPWSPTSKRHVTGM